MKHAPWKLILAIAVAFVGISDLLFLARSRAFVGIGYNSQALTSPLQTAGFLAAGAICDAALILCLVLGLQPVAKRLGRNPLQRLLLTMGLAAMVPVTVNVLLTRVHVVLGTILSLDALFQMAAGDTVGATQEALATTSVALLVTGAIVAVGALWTIARWIGRRFGSGFHALPTKKLATASALTVAAALVVLVWCDARSPTFSFGLRWKASGMALRTVGSWITDFDLDGSGMMSRPPDFAPFDGRRHPYAREVPGNGVDENGLAGDLPTDVQPLKIIASERDLAPGSPSLVLIFLETFRADLLHRELGGIPVTPNLSRLATEAASSSETFTHSAMTWAARAQLLQGRMVPEVDKPTLVDDFREAGYEVAWFSGQHDGARDGERILGFERADVFRDARSDPNKRTTPSTRPVSLQVSWKTVLGSVKGFLEGRTNERRLFLYVNLVDTHFPYDHGELDDILHTERIGRSDIGSDRPKLVWEAYLNAAANVDRAIGQLLESVDKALGTDAYAVVVTADHGEAFYEEGFLGHGQTLDRVQSRVPLIVRGIDGNWPEPLGLSDIRGLLGRHLPNSRPDSRPTFSPEPDRQILQYMGEISHPKRIALRSMDGAVSHEFAAGAPDTPPEGFDALIHAWEALRNEADR